MNLRNQKPGFFGRNWLLIIILLIVVAGTIYYLNVKNKSVGFAGSEKCLEDLNGQDTTGYVKLKVTNDLKDPDDLKFFQFKFNGQSYISCLSSEHTMESYIKPGPLTKPLTVITQLTNTKENVNFTMTIEAYDAAGKLLGKSSNKRKTKAAFITHIFTDILTPAP